MPPVPTLRGDAVILTCHQPQDAAAQVAGEDEETARRFGWWPQRSTEQGVLATYERWAAQWRDDGPRRAFATRDAITGVLVGGCELRISPAGAGEVSYWTHADQRGKGYAKQALALLCEYAATVGVTRLEAHVAVDNHASRHVAKSAGFTESHTITQEGELRIRYIKNLVLAGFHPAVLPCPRGAIVARACHIQAPHDKTPKNVRRAYKQVWSAPAGGITARRCRPRRRGSGSEGRRAGAPAGLRAAGGIPLSGQVLLVLSATSPVRSACRACKRRTTSHLAGSRVGGFARRVASVAGYPVVEVVAPRRTCLAGLFPLGKVMTGNCHGRQAAAGRTGDSIQMNLWRSHQRRNAYQ